MRSATWSRYRLCTFSRPRSHVRRCQPRSRLCAKERSTISAAQLEELPWPRPITAEGPVVGDCPAAGRPVAGRMALAQNLSACRSGASDVFQGPSSSAFKTDPWSDSPCRSRHSWPWSSAVGAASTATSRFSLGLPPASSSRTSIVSPSSAGCSSAATTAPVSRSSVLGLARPRWVAAVLHLGDLGLGGRSSRPSPGSRASALACKVLGAPVLGRGCLDAALLGQARQHPPSNPRPQSPSLKHRCCAAPR